PADRVLLEPEDLYVYSSDATHYFKWRAPEAVVLPETVEEVSQLIRYADKQEVPVTPRGAGSGLEGGCTPIQGGIVADMKRMNKILEINRGNMTAQVESGLVLANFHRAVEKMGLFYPPDPQSKSVCTLGGNVSTRAGGARGIKYGTTPNYVLGLEVVLPDGSVIKTGSKCVKHSVGYDLTHLLTGAEGTLGIITKVTVRLLPLPPAHRTILVTIDTLENAARTVSEIVASGTVPAMLEFLGGMAMNTLNKVLPSPVDTSAGAEAYLLIDLDGTPAQLDHDASAIDSLCRQMNALEMRVIENEKEAKAYWDGRAKLGPMVQALFKKCFPEDITVPRNRIPELVRSIQEISASTGMMIGIAGHLGDGNMHPTLMYPEVNEEMERRADAAVRKMIRLTLDLEGTMSGEHGVGLHKSQYLAWELGEHQVELMKRIKKAFDPKGIMNPGKIWVEAGKA
ncbi:MAG: FAD-linked oxidase C-terminal domain-containing protein, partial [Pseudomonadota bacterium]